MKLSLGDKCGSVARDRWTEGGGGLNSVGEGQLAERRGARGAAKGGGQGDGRRAAAQRAEWDGLWGLQSRSPAGSIQF